MFSKAIAVAVAATLATASQGLAWGDMYMGKSTGSGQPQILAYGGQNNCPTGLQPVVLNGVICCGTPNGSMSYQQMMAHPMPRKAKRAHSHSHTRTTVRTTTTTHTRTYRHSH